VSRENREVLADWLMVAGAAALFASLFMTWSHQLSRATHAYFGTFDPLRDIPSDATAWQVYSAADVAMALLAAGLLGVALIGPRRSRIVALVGSLVALAFTLHALSAPPANGGATVFKPTLAVPSTVSLSPTAGPGETLAILALLVAIAGLGLSFTAD
jgi:hypothetical protein